MPKPKTKKAEKKPDASYEAFRAQWERAKPRRLQRQEGRGKPGDMDYRPPVIGPPRPHKTKAADFLDELLWLGTYVGDERFNQAFYALSRHRRAARSKPESGPKTFAFRRRRDIRPTHSRTACLTLRG